MYVPAVARFTARDPMPQNGDAVLIAHNHLYGYAANDPTNKIDPSGLNPFTDALQKLIDDFDMQIQNMNATVALRFCEVYVAAEELFLKTNWANGLPACPCYQCELNIEPNAGKWTPPEVADQRFHPGAEFCIRSTPKAIPLLAPGQQCCYKGQELITDGASLKTSESLNRLVLDLLNRVS